MLVEPASLCWLSGRMVKARDGVTWAEEFARYPALKAVVRDDGSGLGKGLKLERARRRAAGQSDIDETLDIFHTLREGGRALRTTWGRATRALEAADAGQRGVNRLGRQGTSRTGKVKPINRLWREAEQLWDQATAAETAWKQVKSAFEFFTPEGRLNDRRQAAAVVAAAPPHLSGSAWAKTRRLLLRRESFTFLDQAQARLTGLGLDPDVLSASLDMEGLRRQPWRLSVTTPGSAATRGYCQLLWTGDSQAAGCFLTPSVKTVPLTTSGRSVEPFNARHFFDAESISLYTIVRHADRLPLPFGLVCRSRTVANTLSIGLVVRM